MPDRDDSGVIDTCVYIDLAEIPLADLPAFPELTAITLAELQQGVALAKDASTRAARMERLGAAIASSRGLPLVPV
ncbi:hypothetical protein MF672_045655 [Actinomadura sp. ATCC 31491]|uniref:Type II toxin-antitoxin system VapC family toxin n=1 Tax=Actinomadura luzonensis TaxID=2805427 RepID=A0ABT0G9H4_9ACTN|nr:hypothetical protein [Actinomadura luzonensis]MCK2221043.1 hypothetical protein [Actinomadura luzonensis]